MGRRSRPSKPTRTAASSTFHARKNQPPHAVVRNGFHAADVCHTVEEREEVDMTDFVDPLEEPLGLDARGGLPDEFAEVEYEVEEDSPKSDERAAEGRDGGAIGGDRDNALEVKGRDDV
jgi:hypothetical protein